MQVLLAHVNKRSAFGGDHVLRDLNGAIFADLEDNEPERDWKRRKMSVSMPPDRFFLLSG